MNQMRELFEEFAKREGMSLDMYKFSYLSDETYSAWKSWQAAQSVSVPVVGDVVGWRWIRVSTGEPDGGRFFDGTPSDSAIKTAANSYIPCAPQLLIVQPATSISAAELERLRKDAAKVLHAEQIRIAAVAAVREVTGCPDIKGKDGAYLVDSLIVNLIEMQDDAAIAGEK